MEPRVSYALVGLFVLVLGGALVFAALWLAGVGPAGEMRTYLVYLEESVAGLTVESPVKYQGVDVGKVAQVGLDPHDPGRVRLLIEVRKGIPVNTDTIASLSTQGFTGLVYFIELRGGGPQSGPLVAASGASYPVIPSEPSRMTRLWSKGFALVDDLQRGSTEFRATLAEVRGVLGQENREALSAAFRDAAQGLDRLDHAAGMLDDYLTRFEPTFEDLADTLRTWPDLSHRAANALQAVDAAANEVHRAADRLAHLVADAQPGLLAFTRDGLPQMEPLLRDLRELSARLDRLAGEIEDDPNLLLRGRARRPGPGER